MTRRAPLLVTLLCSLGLFGCDHATKQVAAGSLEGREPVVLVAGVVDLQYRENRGVAFSLERFVPRPLRAPIMLAAPLLALGALAWAWRRHAAELSARTAAFALLAAGVLGNAVDRFARGYVVDFIHVHHWPIFNVADVCLVAGVALLLLAERRATAGPAARR
jgi:signal peptidase II